MKTCTKCQEEKNLSDFYCDKKGKNGLCSVCKSCCKKNTKEYRKTHPKKDTYYEYDIKWRERNPDKMLGYRRKWRERNPSYNREWNARNPDYHLNYQKNRTKSDPAYRLARNARVRIWGVLKNNLKSATTFELIGCGIDILKAHLEKQFQSGMTWDNYGEWHVDHIIPCASFDLSKSEEQRKCFHYTNLQPLWGNDNMSKGARKN